MGEKCNRLRCLRGSVSGLALQAGAEVGHGQHKEDGQKEQSRDHYQFEQSFVSAFDVHEEECDQESFRRRDNERDRGVESAEVQKGGFIGDEGSEQERAPDDQISGERR